MKSAFYFDHDYNARNDLKILELRSEFGWEGYGLFWALIETLCEQSGHIKREALGGLSLGLSTDKAKLINMIDFCIKIGLLYENESGISNQRSLDHIAFRKSLSDYGKKGGRPKKQQEEKPPESPPLATPKPGKERKEIIYSDFYDAEIEKSKGKIHEANYLKAIQKIYGKIGIYGRMDKILSIKKQLSYSQFETLIEKSFRLNVNLTELIEDFDNYNGKYKPSTVYRSLSGWMDNRNKKSSK